MSSAERFSEDEIARRARALHFDFLVVDTHVDVAQRCFFEKFDFGPRDAEGCIDIPRLREGGVGALFCAAWVPPDVTGTVAVKRAFNLLDAMREQVRRHPADLALAATVAEIRSVHAAGKIAIVLCVEGGHAIDNDLGLLRIFATLGVRYLTLTHFADLDWAGSSGGAGNKGLTPFGREVIAEMNRLGMVVDLSHVSDRTFSDVLAITRAPAIASHSCCRALCDSPRNLTDEMIRALAAGGGALQINFHTSFLSQKNASARRVHAAAFEAHDQEIRNQHPGNEARIMIEHQRLNDAMIREGKLPRVSWEEIVEHIDHAVQIAGAEHVGIGSDFDGARMPEGMEDASKLPRITEALVRRGYADRDIRMILGENALRVLSDAERVAEELSASAV
ncbi:MAG: dipeptidase [Candidatus Acidiferrales bacterium]